MGKPDTPQIERARASRRLPAPKQSLDASAAQALHDELDRLIRLRRIFERARRDPDFHYFRRAPSPSARRDPFRPRKRIEESYAWGLCLYQQGLDFIARVIGDEALGTAQRAFDVEAALSSGWEQQHFLTDLLPLLPHRVSHVIKHRLVAVLWLHAKLANARVRKSAYLEVGDAYGRGPETIRAWTKQCAAAFGEGALAKARDRTVELGPEAIFRFVFGQGAGPKSLADCGRLFKECCRATKRDRRTGRPKQKVV